MPPEQAQCLLAKGLAGAELPDDEPAAVLIAGKVIKALGRAALEAEAEQVELGDLWLSPAPIDTHVHLRLGGKLADNLAATRAAGICAVRDLGNSLKSTTPANPDGEAPLVFASGHGLGATGEGGCWLAEKLKGPAAMAEAVERRAGEGAPVIKLFASGLLDFDNPGQVLYETALSCEEMAAAVQKAHEYGLPVAAHVHGDAQVRRAVAAGVDCVEHGYFITPATQELMAERGTFWAPTIGAVLGHARDRENRWDQATRDNLWRIAEMQTKSLQSGAEIGVRLVAGTDAGSYGMGHDIALYTEIETWLEAGISPYTVYEAVTKQAAMVLNAVQIMGVMSVGSGAFLCGCIEDPRENPRALFQAPFHSF